MPLLRGVGHEVSEFVDRTALHRYPGPQGGQRRFQSLAAVDNHQRRSLQPSGLEILEQIGPRRLALPGPGLEPREPLLPIGPYPQGPRIDKAVLCRSRRTCTPVPSRISRTIGSPSRRRRFQASKSSRTRCQARLTVSCSPRHQRVSYFHETNPISDTAQPCAGFRVLGGRLSESKLRNHKTGYVTGYKWGCGAVKSCSQKAYSHIFLFNV